MTEQDPTDPVGLRFVFSVECEPLVYDHLPCVWCNHPQIVSERKWTIADNADREPGDIPTTEALCMADYQFVIGHAEGEGRRIPVCSGCLVGMSVEYGDSDTHDLPYRWEDEVCKRVSVPRLDADAGHVHRTMPVAELADLGTELQPEE